MEPSIQPKKSKTGIITLVVLALFIGASLMYLVMYYFPIDNSETIINKTEKEVTVTDAGIADAVDKLYDAVVAVYAYNNGNLYSSGTGFVFKVIDDKAYIITNNHVVSNATETSVLLTNDKTLNAKIVGKDTYSDIAVLSVNKDDIISVASVGSSENVRVGDTVFTVGAPLSDEYYGTVTRGIISGKDRLVPVALSNSYTEDYKMKVLQTDAAINSGNSGGPLANANGEVIGVTNMKLVSSGVEGIAFAIPIEDAMTYVDMLIEDGTVSRPYLGVRMCSTSDISCMRLANVRNFTVNGVYLYDVEEDSNAEKAGFQIGDVIVEFNGESIASVSELKYQLYRHKIGETVTVSVFRNKTEKKIKLKLTGE